MKNFYNKSKGFSLVELIISIVIISMVVGGALLAFQIMQQNTSSSIALNKSNQISDFVFNKMERDIKQAGIFYDIDTISDYNFDSDLVAAANNYDIDNILEIKSSYWTLDICYDRTKFERIRVKYRYDQDSSTSGGNLRRKKKIVTHCNEGLNNSLYEPIAKGIENFEIDLKDNKLTLNLSLRGTNAITYNYEKIILFPQI